MVNEHAKSGLLAKPPERHFQVANSVIEFDEMPKPRESVAEIHAVANAGLQQPGPFHQYRCFQAAIRKRFRNLTLRFLPSFAARKLCSSRMP